MKLISSMTGFAIKISISKVLMVLVILILSLAAWTRADKDVDQETDEREWDFGPDFEEIQEGTYSSMNTEEATFEEGMKYEEGILEKEMNYRYTVDGVAMDRGHTDKEIDPDYHNQEEDHEYMYVHPESHHDDTWDEAMNIRICEDIDIQFEKPAETFTWNKIADKEIYSFSAFYDPRPSVGGPLVRVLSNGHQEMFHNSVIPLYCVFIFSGVKHAVSVLATYKSLYDSHAIPDESTGHWIECSVPERYGKKHNVPVSVTVLPSKCAPKPTFWLPVQVRKERDRKQRIALCTPALYKGKDWVQIAEWIFLHKRLGYSTVYFYVTERGRSVEMTNRFLIAFEHNWDPDIRVVTVPWSWMKTCFYYCQHAAINDCLYRAGLEHDYVTVGDKDEVLMPLKHDSILSFLAEFETDHAAAFMFQHVMFDERRKEKLTRESIIATTGIDIEGFNIDINTFQPWTLTQKWHMKYPYPAAKIRSKTIYHVDRTVSADIHFPKELVAPFTEYLVAPYNGVIYHYKINAPDEWLNNVPYVQGSQVERFQIKLLKDMIRLLIDLNSHE